jgi:hypothetical protein
MVGTFSVIYLSPNAFVGFGMLYDVERGPETVLWIADVLYGM